MRLRLAPEKTSIKFMESTKPAMIVSGVLMVLSVLSVMVFGLNFGIDFRGGTMMIAATDQPVAVAEYRELLEAMDVGDVAVTEISDPAEAITGAAKNSVQIRIEQQNDDPAIQNVTIVAVKGALSEKFPDIKFLATEAVGSKVSGELIQAAILAVVLAVGAVLFYIWLRFEWQFSVGAVAALVHDVVLTIGIFSVTQMEFDLKIIAAVLTIVGYSLNDTVVVFDRVRENLRKFKSTELREVLNGSINETLSRTLMTSLTTLLALVSLFVLGGAVIHGFTSAMIIGVFVGTYSSVFIASAILLRLGVKRDWSKQNPAAGTQYANIDA